MSRRTRSVLYGLAQLVSLSCLLAGVVMLTGQPGWGLVVGGGLVLVVASLAETYERERTRPTRKDPT